MKNQKKFIKVTRAIVSSGMIVSLVFSGYSIATVAVVTARTVQPSIRVVSKARTRELSPSPFPLVSRATCWIRMLWLSRVLVCLLCVFVTWFTVATLSHREALGSSWLELHILHSRFQNSENRETEGARARDWARERWDRLWRPRSLESCRESWSPINHQACPNQRRVCHSNGAASSVAGIRVTLIHPWWKVER